MMPINKKLDELIEDCKNYGLNPTPTKRSTKSPTGYALSKSDCSISLQEWSLERYRLNGDPKIGERFLIDNDFCPMLAAKLSDCKMDIDDAFALPSDTYFAQTKLDGTRILIYKGKDSDKLSFFSRNLCVVDYLPIDYANNIFVDLDMSKLQGMEFMVDCELVVSEVPSNDVLESFGLPIDTTQLNLTTALLNTDRGTKSFQELYPLKFYAFDLVLLDGEVLFDSPLSRRLVLLNNLMHSLLAAGFNIEKPLDNTSMGLSISDFHKKMLINGEEGSIVKNLFSPYCTTGVRTHKAWIKLKRSIADSLLDDTFDGFITGFRNKQGSDINSWRVGSIELSAYLLDDNDNFILDEDGNPMTTVIANVSGLTDDFAKEISVPDELNEGMCKLDVFAYGRVFEVNGQDFTPTSKTLMNAKIVRERFDKQASHCTVRKSFIESQIF